MGFSRLFMLPISTILVLVVSLLLFPFEWAWFWIFGSVGFIFILSSWLIPFLWFKKVPEPARVLVECAQKGRVPAFIAHDSGRGRMISFIEKLGEGVVETSDGRYRILPRFVKIRNVLSNLAKLSNQAETNEETLEAGELTENDNSVISSSPDNAVAKLKERLKKHGYELDYFSDLMQRRSIMVGLNLPFYIAYSGKICLMNPMCQAWFQAGEVFIPTADNPEQPDGENKPMPLMLLDPLEMKTIINQRFDTSQVNAIAIDSEELGRAGRGMPSWVFPVALVAVLAALAIGAFMFLPSMLGM